MIYNILVNIFLFQMCYGIANSIPISIERFGYTTYSGITVAINSRVPQNEQIIKNIENIFIEASSILYKATRNKAFFKEITIAIPSTWKLDAKYENVTGDFFTDAHFRIDYPNPEYGDEPYTLQTEGCGQPGTYIHYTPNYILNPISQRTFRANEIPGHRLVQEWSRFRYGIFEEFGHLGHPKYKTFYFDNEKNKILPTGCTKAIEGSFDLSDPNCKASVTEGDTYLDELLNCTSIPQESETETASIMFTASLPDVTQFCDSFDDNEGRRRHNSEAPNKQNDLCEGRSTWDVVSNHVDLKTAARGDDLQITKPKFRYVRKLESFENRLVWVLDYSYSMRGKPIKLLTEATSRCLLDPQCVMNKDQIGLVSFNSQAKVLSELVKVETNSDRELLVNLIPQTTGNGRTAIGRSLLKAFNVLTANNKTAEGGVIILVTDGKEIIGPKIVQVLPWLVKNKVRVTAIALGPNASEKLEILTTSTGGKLYFVDNVDGSSFGPSLDHTFFEAATTQIDVTLKPVTIVNERLESFYPKTIRDIVIEKVLGKNTVFVIQATDFEEYLDVTVIKPNGSEITRNSSEVDVIKSNGIKFLIPMAEHGVWKVVLQTRYPVIEPVDLMVRSWPLESRHQPVRVKVWASDNEVNFPSDGLVIFAEVKREYVAIINAKVVATVTRPNASLVEVELKDDGATPDLEQNDGVYSAYFGNFSGSGRYGLTAKVINDGNAKLKFTNKRFKRDSNGFDSEPLEDFERFVVGEVFKVRNFQELDSDVVSPAKVTDLEVIEQARFSSSEFVVALRWTSPGDDFNTGQATSLELRYSRDIDQLRRNFQECFQVLNSSWLLGGQPIPLPPGEKQEAVVRLFAESSATNATTLYFAVVVKDEANNTSSVSNIGRAFFDASNDRGDIEIGRVSRIQIGLVHESHMILATLISLLIYCLTISIIIAISFVLIRKSSDFQRPYRRIKA